MTGNTSGIDPRPESGSADATTASLRAVLGSVDGSGAERRSDPRFDFEVQPAALRFEFTPGQARCHHVTPQNLSHNGAGFSIDTFLAPQSPCKFLITGLDQSTVEVSATIARCDHRRAGVFDAAVRFDQAIDLRRFVRLAASANPPLPTVPAAIVRFASSDGEAEADASGQSSGQASGQASIRWYVHPTRLAADSMTFVHGQPFDIDQPCDVVLFNKHGQRLELSALVRSTRTLSDLQHEVELVFDRFPQDDETPPDATQSHTMVRSSETDQADESVGKSSDTRDPLDLDNGIWLAHAPAMVIDEFDLDRHLLRALLTRLGLRVTDVVSLAGTSQSGDSKNRWTTFEIVLLDVGSHSADALDCIRAQRASGYEGVVIAMSADERPDIHAAALAAGANAFLLKPFDHIQVHTLLNRLLSKEQSAQAADPGEPITSTKTKDRGLASLLDEFVGNLANHIASLHRALEDADHASLASTCRLLQGAGTGYGFEAVSKRAAKTLDTLADPEPATREVESAVRELIDILTRIRR